MINKEIQKIQRSKYIDKRKQRKRSRFRTQDKLKMWKHE